MESGDSTSVGVTGEKTTVTSRETLAEVGSLASSGVSDVAKAVVEAAYNLALQCPFPGVCEAATLVSVLVNLVRDDQGNTAEMESKIKRCRLVILILQRAAMVLGKVRRHGPSYPTCVGARRLLVCYWLKNKTGCSVVEHNAGALPERRSLSSCLR